MAAKKKYATEAQRLEAIKETKRKWREKQKGKPGAAASARQPKSWVGALGKKLQAVGEDIAPEEAERPPERPGEPFADLPPLDLPTSPTSGQPSGSGEDGQSPSSTDANASSAGAGEVSESNASTSGKSAANDNRKVFDSSQLELMATQLAHDAVMGLGGYAAERGFFALGEPFAKLAGIAAGVLVKVHAKNVGIDDEEAAAWILGGVLGVNAGQAFRAKLEEDKKKKEAKVNDIRSAVDKQQAERHVNGVTRDEVMQQTAKERDAARDEQARTGGAVV